MFLLTVDRALLSIYGARVICDNLLYFEFMACRSDIGANSKKSSQCLGTFYYLNQQMEVRIKNIDNDQMHAQSLASVE